MHIDILQSTNINISTNPRSEHDLTSKARNVLPCMKKTAEQS